MAARFDAARARELGQTTGDGTPIMLTIPTDEPWVPLRILGLGLDPDQVVEADVFLLTDEKPKMLAGGPGLSLARDEPASTFLLDDLRSDKGMEWVPPSMWLTYMPLEAKARDLDYDLALGVHPTSLPSVRDAGVGADEVRRVTAPAGPNWWPWVAGVALALTAFFAIGAWADHRRSVAGSRLTG
jgi:hypothetical protein